MLNVRTEPMLAELWPGGLLVGFRGFPINILKDSTCPGGFAFVTDVWGFRGPLFILTFSIHAWGKFELTNFGAKRFNRTVMKLGALDQ